MIKAFTICLTILSALFSINNTSYYNNQNSNFKKSISINNIDNKNIKIEIINIETINSAINLDEMYEAYSIITVDITNTGLEYLELANINYSIYQGDKKLQSFIQSQNEYLGFIGTLDSGEKKEIKLGVVLEEKNTPLKLVFENLGDINKEKIIKIINI